MKLDQFYTNPKVANKLISKMFRKLKINPKDYKYLEPSAGSGNFIDTLKMKFDIPWNSIEAYDLEPMHIKVKKKNFFEINKRFNDNRIIIGNPPFGKRSSLAIDFINKSATMAPTIAMILPKQFNRYLTQKQIDHRLKLVFSVDVEEQAFLVENRRYDVKTVFQIWTYDERYSFKNKRLLKQEPINHPDFESWIHNNTKETTKYFDKNKYEWEFAIHRQGFYDYNKFIFDENKLQKNRQYLFVKPKNKEALDILMNMDIQKLSNSNTQTPGYSKTDFVREYRKLKRKRRIK